MAAGARPITGAAWDWLLECEGGVGLGAADTGDGEVKRADLGLPTVLGAGEGDEAFLANGLLRTDMMQAFGLGLNNRQRTWDA